jgi:pimeloyl-ACP methyl ester carboxylesterase
MSMARVSETEVERMAHSESLGAVRTVQLPQGATIRYRERGQGSPVVFVHGLLANANLWRDVVPGVADEGFRCIAPDWPLGSHEIPMPATADLSPPGVARLIADFLAALELRDVTLVANDTGGALVQVLMAAGLASGRIGRVVLTPSDSFERFFPPMFSYLPPLARVPGTSWVLAQALRPRALHRLPLTFGWLSKRPIPPAVMDSFLLPSRTDPAIRRDLARFLRDVHKRHTLAAVDGLRRFDKPVLLAWAAEDRLFPVSLAHRLVEVLPNARLTTIADCYTFVPEDQPAELVELITEFLGSPARGHDGEQ